MKRRLEPFHKVLIQEVIVIAVMANLEQLKNRRLPSILYRERDFDDILIHWHVYTFYCSLVRDTPRVPAK